jgi:hypothetical protein
MENVTLREKVLTSVQRLSLDELKIVNAFIAFLEAGADANAGLNATEQAVAQSFKQSWLEAQNGQIHPIHELEWN